jgi:hypothetical protein
MQNTPGRGADLFAMVISPNAKNSPTPNRMSSLGGYSISPDPRPMLQFMLRLLAENKSQIGTNENGHQKS